jgi:Na+-driven multidrug efflux pump
MLIVLPMFLGVTGVWLSMPLSDAASSIVSAIMIGLYIKKQQKKL